MRMILITLVFLSLLLSGCQVNEPITNFEECIAAGNPIMESYPGQCMDPMSNRTFTEEIDADWKLDEIILMQHETEGYYGCFGCNILPEGEGLCVDPVQEMVEVEETSERYCNSDFEVVESS
jgi:hypothetical protein